MGAMVFAHSWDVCDHEIERLCAYLDDDKVAAYFAIKVERVTFVRSKMARGDRYLRALEGGNVTRDEAINASTRKAEAEAEKASNALLYAIERSGQKLAPELPKRKLTFDEQLALVASGRVGIVELR